MAFTRGCKVNIDLKKIPEYIDKLREENEKSADITPNSKYLIDKIIRAQKKKIEPLWSEPQNVLAELGKEINSLEEMDIRIVAEMEECFNYVTRYLEKHGLQAFEKRILRKNPSDVKYDTPLPRVSTTVTIKREDHCGTLEDLKTRVEAATDLQPVDKELLLPFIEKYCNNISCKCKVEDEYVENIKARIGQFYEKSKPFYGHLQKMQDWISRLRVLDEVEV